MEPNGAKGIAIVILFFSSLIFSWLAIWLFARGTLTASGSPRRRLVLAFFNCFSGGVFLGTCLIHLMAEGREELDHYLKEVKVIVNNVTDHVTKV